jgi:DNA repair protein RadC
MWDRSLINIQEQTAALYLNSQNQAIGYRLISSGKLSSAGVDKSLLLSCALLIRASAIILAHNHPSGELFPSKADIRSTCQLQKAINLIDCRLVDHLILSENGWYSMADGNNFIPDL